MIWFRLFGFLAFVVCPFLLGQMRVIPHLTTGDLFETEIWLHNSGTTSQTLELQGYLGDATAFPVFQTTLRPGETEILNPNEDLGQGAAYATVMAESDVKVAARYRSTQPGSGWAHVVDATQESQAWQFYAGNPSQTWDGFALVNRGNEPAAISLRQWDLAGREIASSQIVEALAPGAKALFVLSDILQPVEAAVYRVTASQPLALVGIRGNQNRDFLWENPTQPVLRTVAETPLTMTVAFPELFFNQPVDLQAPGDGSNRLFVVEQRGVIRVFDQEAPQTATTFLDIREQVTFSGEMGLLGLAFHPQFSQNGVFWVNYISSLNGPRRTVLARFQVDAANPNVANRQSETVVLEVNQPRGNHNGGQLAFGPDGYLYMSLGDSGGGGDPDGAAQNRAVLLGSILRLDVPVSGDGYQIPADNPFVGNQNGWREEIFAFGLRNPWRFSFDTSGGQTQIWAADVGQDRLEEINLITSGGNYGWNRLEGSDCFPPGSVCNGAEFEAPIYEYNHDRGDRSITGGYVYRSQDIPELMGAYVYADFVSGRVWALRYEENSGAQNWQIASLPPQTPAAFGRNDRGDVFLCSFDGRIYRIDYSSTTTKARNRLVER